MASRAVLRASDPVVGKGILKNAVIELDGKRQVRSDARTKELKRPAKERDMTDGYLALMRDSTLAGRHVSRNFMKDEDDYDSASASRLRMVGKLRKKEKWLMWKYLFHDLNRAVAAFFSRITPSQLLKPQTNNLNYEEELAKYLQRVELQQDAVQPTCSR
ncbi:MAG: hypothetical protein JSS83_23510 [Cyanobacteria bacterium SZAS LIN-3]|nr:hypothetical protein [Cyanobacteria bacterium SZAS LIN-3]